MTQNGVPFFQKNESTSTIEKFRRLFAEATCFVAAIPVYVGGHMAMGLATDDKRLRRHSGKDHRPALPQSRQLCHAILDTGSPRGGFRPTALHCRYGGKGGS